MTKSELIHFLNTYAQLNRERNRLYKELEPLEDRIAAEKKAPIKETRQSIGVGIGVYLVFTAVFFVASFIIGFIIIFINLVKDPDDGWANNFLDHTSIFIDGHPMLSLLAIWLIASAIIMLPICIFLHIHHNMNYKKNNIKAEQAYLERCKQLAPIEHKIQQIRNRINAINNQQAQMERSSGISSLQLTWPADLAYYLETGRADTLKEALNLLDADLDREAREQREKAFQKQMLDRADAQLDALNSIQSETERAADAAEDAAFWGAASTFITANALDKIRKDINEK